MNNIEEKFKLAAREAGIHFDLLLSKLHNPRRLSDGSYQARCPAHEDKSPSLNVRLSETGKVLVKCYAGCSADAICAAAGIPLFANAKARPLTPAEKAEQRRQREESDRIKREKQAATAERSRKTWAALTYADNTNPYCHRKNIQPHGCKTGSFRSWRNCLIVPMHDESGELVNLQYILPEKPADGSSDKFNGAGGKVKGAFFVLGEEVTGQILIAEGFSTAASLFEDSGLMTYCSFGTGNLSTTAAIVRAKHPCSEIIVCGDNDAHGKGQDAARSAALACGGKWIIPPIVGDFNDYLNNPAVKEHVA
jgi:putative DNA primase/helicase